MNQNLNRIRNSLRALASDRTEDRCPRQVFDEAPGLFMRSAIWLLTRSDLAAAICGEKKSLPDELAYYRAFYEFAARQPNLAVVRIFGTWCEDQEKAKRHCHTHNRTENVMGLWVQRDPGLSTPLMKSIESLMEPTGFGLVLFKSSQVVTALMHWGASPEDFQWTVTSDPIVTTTLLDTWGYLSQESRWRDDTDSPTGDNDALIAFRRRFGIVVDK